MYGIIPACDFFALEKLEQLLGLTCGLECVKAYKIGAHLSAAHGVRRTVEIIRKYTAASIIYDHQKFGTDTPEVCGEIVGFLKESGVDSVIIFPQAGKRTLTAAVNACWKEGLVPIVGGEMTHKGYLRGEGGYLADDAPMRIYLDAARLGVSHFVIPGTKALALKRYNSALTKLVKDPTYLIPGIGGQGGSLAKVKRALANRRIYAIIGRGIYEAEDMAAAVQAYWRDLTSGR